MRLQSLLPVLALAHAVRGNAPATGQQVSPLEADGLEARGLEARGLEARDPEARGLEARDLEARDLEARNLAKKLWNKIKWGGGCVTCETVFALMRGLAFLSDSALIKVVQSLCKMAGAQDDDVCEGAIAREGPIIAQALREMKRRSKASKEFCTTLLGACAYTPVTPWNVSMPVLKPKRTRPRPSGKKPLQVVHYSDIHIDTLYMNGSSADCGKPICCRPYTEDDQPGKSKSPAGPFGDHKCDVPVSLEQSMYEAINKFAPDAAFTIFTGDIVDHAVWNTTESANVESIERAYSAMHRRPGPVYGTAGNHEAHPCDGFQPNGLGQATAWVYRLLSSQWSSWIGKEAADNAAKLGAYSVKHPVGNLRVISLNTNLYYRNNFWLYHNMNDKDPNLQLQWLVRELDRAEKARENVYIIGHLPFGDKGTLHDGSNYLDQIVNRYSATIAAMFFGHTHVDQFEISYADYQSRSEANALAVSYIAPSLTPTAGMPSFRVYEVDPDTFGVLDATTYIADMGDKAFQSGPVWTKLYSAKEAYGKALSPPVTDPRAELTPAFWHQVTKAFEDDDELFDAYISRKSRGWNVAKCRGSCRADEICQLRAGRAQDNCYKPKFGFHLERRDMSAAHGEHDECDELVTRTTFGALVARDSLERFVEMAEEEIARAGNVVDKSWWTSRGEF
ncbi:calcineurin-like phosphoesterase [Hirsutella rhossiliensis]|uniref:Calcineurin-like phosphoesterase domain-containing protein n=1 Tax=Hirsutella rhossiliensis TaxID=111463 RepID=A0A9P8N1L1_9HYPO|nr:calcineurin-like phosphoesterase domain-containing protein [Hirsutella rhossiliensis]KAH0965184.1 calcineurin-like phosphoesterase domain-containing protein [Hirsutella rhossiliensis]